MKKQQVNISGKHLQVNKFPLVKHNHSVQGWLSRNLLKLYLNSGSNIYSRVKKVSGNPAQVFSVHIQRKSIPISPQT